MLMIIFVILTEEEFQELKGGNKAVYVKIYNEYKKPVYNLLLSRCLGNRDIAMDVVQDTFLTAIKSFHKVKSPGHLEAWLITIAKNKLVDHFRKAGRDKKYIEKLAEKESEPADVLEELHEKEQVSLLYMAMEKIKPLYKDLLRMRCWQGLKVKEIAGKTGKTPKAVENMLFRAKESLKKQITNISRGFEI
jgi:RNA polymerase sigma-70 factor (ECF subfamily)